MDTEYTVLNSVPEYENHWYTGGYDTVRQPYNSTKKYYWVDLPDAVAIVPILDETLVLVTQHRPAAQETFHGVPTGIVDSGETYEDAARRELQEETGYTAETVTVLTEMHVAPGVLRHKRGIVIAEGLTHTTQALDENEFISVELTPITDVLANTTDIPVGEPTLSAVLLAHHHNYI